MHAATLLGAAFLLKKHEAELKGRVKLLFQPGEETFEGAAAAIRDGLFKEPSIDAAFAMHVNSALPVGTILYGEYPMAAVYGFKITLTGVGGHGSAPEYCIDPINTGVHIYLALQELIARECPPSQEAALTIGQFQAGSASNIIPQTAVLQGTLRTFDKKLRETLVRRIRETAEGVAATYRTKIELEVLSDLPSVADDLELNREAAVCIQNMYPEMKLLPLFHTMASEDFSLISEQVPSGYFNIGAAVEEETEVYGQHNPKVRFNEKALPAAAAIYAGVAADWLERHSG